MTRQEMHDVLRKKHNIYEKAAHKAADIVWDLLDGDTRAKDEEDEYIRHGIIHFK